MNTIIGDILVDNPWGCTPYVSGGETIPAVQNSSEYYKGTVIYENDDGKQVGRVSVRSPGVAGFDSNIATILANIVISTAMGGVSSHEVLKTGLPLC